MTNRERDEGGGKNKLRSASTLGDAIGQLKRKKFSERERERERARARVCGIKQKKRNH